MVGNATSVTAAQARTSASSTVASAAARVLRPLALGGKELAQSGQELPAEPQTLPPADIAAAVRRLNELMAERQRNLSFHVDAASGRTVITVVDALTSKVVRQIPSEEVLALARALAQARGSLDVRI